MSCGKCFGVTPKSKTAILFLLAPSPSLIASINRRLENVKTEDIWSGKAQRSLRRNSLIENCRKYARRPQSAPSFLSYRLDAAPSLELARSARSPPGRAEAPTRPRALLIGPPPTGEEHPSID